MAYRRRHLCVLLARPTAASLRGIAEAQRVLGEDAPPLSDAERVELEQTHAAVPYTSAQGALPLRLGEAPE